MMKLKGVRQMKKNVSLIITLFLIFMMTSPVCAAVQLDVNGRNYDSTGQTVIQDDITMAPLAMLADTLGCTITEDGININIQENQDCLKMSVNSTTAYLNDIEKIMPRAPIFKDGKVHVPIRFVYESFGASVDWQDSNKSISVSYPETRNDLSAEELLSKSSQIMIEANRYKMTVDAKIDMDINVQESNKSPENMKMQMDTHIIGWIQSNPVLMYMKQDAKMKPDEITTQSEPQNIQSEMLMNDSGIYMTMPDLGWVKMNLPGLNIQEILKQSNSQDPVAAMQQMKEMGMSMSFANDQEKNGQKYWVIDTAMGGGIYKSDYFKQISKATGMAETPEMLKMLENMDADINYSTWINQETLYTDFMNMDSRIKIDTDIPSPEKPIAMNMTMAMKANYSLSDYGIAFSVPDVTKAVDFETAVSQIK